MNNMSEKNNVIQTMEDLDDFVLGSVLYGSGGGGSPDKGKELLVESFQQGKKIEWTPTTDLSDDEWVCTAFFMGPSSPPTEEEEKEKIAKGMIEKKEKRVLVRAVRELERELNVTISAIIPVEPGGYNFPAPLDAAAQMGVKLVDGDLVGRAIPEVAMAMPTMEGMPICPITCCDPWGNVTVIRETHSYGMAEALGKMLSLPAYEPIGLAAFAMQIKDLKRMMAEGTMTKSLMAGRAVRKAKASGKDPVAAMADVSGGKDFFRGKVTEFDWGIVNGYFQGEIQITGSGAYAGKQMRVWFRNENSFSWIDGEISVTTPDIIQLVLAESGVPLVNMQLETGMNVAVLAIPHPLYRTEKGMALLGPARYGFNEIQYRPMEEVLSES